ncbi:autotransporter outer membrane beta-barrel domain-containing protein [Ketobacter alkanivorans]|uniref:Autotransporter domain-containing protein n=1 Tax=Ketobacter alkanivorans TaxID=1917421 RepID=A0A2K9LNR3_9GAMM|nr:autotransporter outer membrane beta-barrel domain-containing protein [Ketobacter alkanivorans]AUM14009.1 hypothetical protein Kalk_16940 [Ketobacter alkanivorans]
MHFSRTILNPVELSIILLGSLLSQLAWSNQNQIGFESVIDDVCQEISQSEGGDYDFETFADACFSETSDDPSYQEAQAQITPDEEPALHTSLVQISSDQISNIGNHLSGRRQQQHANNESTALLSPELEAYYGGMASSELFSAGKLSAFLSGSMVDGSQDDTDYEMGYDLTTEHYTVGLDWQLNAQWLVGIAYGHTETELKYNTYNDQTDNSSDHILLYSSWYRENFAVDTTIGYSTGEFDSVRQLPGGEAVGNTDNSMYYISVAGSFDFNQGGWSYGPLSGLDYLDGQIDAFSEQSDTPWHASFDTQDVKSMIFTMGGQTSYAKSFSWGVLVPHAKAIWRTELEDDRDLIVGRFVESPQDQFSITPDDPDTSWYEVSVGLSAVMPHGISAFINYEEVLSYDDTDLSTISAGARLEF